MATAMPLDGVRVLDMATVLAGPVTATMLGDFGADVIKVELPAVGDTTRGTGAPRGRSPQWVQEGRNKRSVTIDLHLPAGQALLRRLAGACDVVIENFRPGTAERWQVDAATLRREYPRLIVMRLSGYGQTGPYREKPAYDRAAQAFAGTTYATGYPDAPPVRDGFAVADYMAAYMGAYAVMLALRNREMQHGSGQVIDLALYEPVFRASEGALIDYSLTGRVRERNGNHNRNVVPAGNHLSGDNVWLVIHAGSARLWPLLAQAIGQPSLVQDARFNTHVARVQNQEALYRIIDAWTVTQSAAAIVATLEAAGVPVERVRSIKDIVAEPHFWQRGNIVEWQDEDLGRVLMPSVLPALSESPGRIRWLGPALSAHTDEVLRELLAIDEGELTALHDMGVL